jgi:hypothetical protein
MAEFGQNDHDISQFFPEIVNHLRIISVVLSCSGLFVEKKDYSPRDVVNTLDSDPSVVLPDESEVEAAFNSKAARIVVKAFDDANITWVRVGLPKIIYKIRLAPGAPGSWSAASENLLDLLLAILVKEHVLDDLHTKELIVSEAYISFLKQMLRRRDNLLADYRKEDCMKITIAYGT